MSGFMLWLARSAPFLVTVVPEWSRYNKGVAANQIFTILTVAGKEVECWQKKIQIFNGLTAKKCENLSLTLCKEKRQKNITNIHTLGM